jgi:hypothetical protein
MKYLPTFTFKFFLLISVFFLFTSSTPIAAQQTPKNLYDQIKEFSLDGGKAEVSSLVLKRDRAIMEFNGTFYFATPVNGKVTGAVFIGQGNFKAEVPPNQFEKENVKRLLDDEVVQSTFENAVFRFTDDTFDIIGKDKIESEASPKALELASDSEPRILKETGANISSRLVASILNKEEPGFFFASFDGGKRDRFHYVLDHQGRIPTVYFGINGGEKGLIYRYLSAFNNTEVWLAFYSLQDYQDRFVTYSDVNDLVDVTHYDLDLDLLDPKDKLGLKAKVTMKTRSPNINAITFSIGEALGESGKQRLKKQMRLKRVLYGDKELDFTQEDWESSLTVYLPEAVKAGQEFDLNFEMEGDFVRQAERISSCNYPRSNTSWYPRHGYLDRATYNMSFTHSKKLKIASIGVRQSEEVNEDEDTAVTKYKMDHPVSFVTFALAPFKRYTEMIKWDSGETPTPLEYNSIPYIPIKEDFILAELNNSIRYFHSLFGKYPYENYGATYHPYGFGQGFPSMVMIPNSDRANKYTYAFIAHETAHQWWGNIVAWRSYRDQWLSEGFAEYSGVLYTSLRKDYGAAENLITEMRRSLEQPPRTSLGVGKGKLNDVGPLILGHRLNTDKTTDAYQTLIYNKGALVLRMLHYMFTDPETGNGDAFFNMMKDFVERYRNKTASTEDFMAVANEHFVKTSIAKKYNVKDLNWFFKQWVYGTGMPSYRLEYTFEDQKDGSTIMIGTVTQEDVPDDWAMVLPVVFTFKGDKQGVTSVIAYGPKQQFKLKFPMKPKKVELDPSKWILSDKTKTD